MSDPQNSPAGGRRGSRWPLFVGLPLIVAVALAAVFLSSGGQEGPGEGEGASSGTAEPAADSGGEGAREGGPGLGAPTLGSADAPVVMREYGDYG